MPKDHLTDLSPVLQDVSTARGLPNAHYTDPGVYREEADALLFSNWAGVGSACGIA